MVLESIAGGAVMGAVYGVLGYIKNNSADAWEEFDFRSLLTTVVGSAAIGGVLGYSNPDFTQSEYGLFAVSATGVFITQVARKIVKTIREHYGF